MPLLLIAIFIGVPVLEIAVFIQAGELFGLWPTLAGVVATAIIGGAMIRAQGLVALERARRSVDQGQIPVAEVFTAVCLLVAGALLLTPGFVTDSVGFLLLVPPLRLRLGRWAMTALARGRSARVWVDGEEIVTPHDRERGGRPDAIDVDYTEIRDGDEKRRPD